MVRGGALHSRPPGRPPPKRPSQQVHEKGLVPRCKGVASMRSVLSENRLYVGKCRLVSRFSDKCRNVGKCRTILCWYVSRRVRPTADRLGVHCSATQRGPNSTYIALTSLWLQLRSSLCGHDTRIAIETWVARTGGGVRSPPRVLRPRHQVVDQVETREVCFLWLCVPRSALVMGIKWESD